MILYSIDVEKKLARFEKFPRTLQMALVSHVEAYAVFLQAYIRTNKLSGSPLNRRSGNLSDSVSYAPITVTDTEVSTTEGTNLKYGRVHELGGSINVPSHQRTISMVFGKPVSPHSITVKQYTAEYPKRAWLKPSINETGGNWKAQIDAAIKEATNVTA